MRTLQDQAILAAEVPGQVATKLDSWAAWMRNGTGARGYPSRSCGIESGGIHTSDDAEAQADSFAARACDGAIASLSKPQELAIWAYWIGSSPVGVHPERLHLLVVSALPIIYRGLMSRGCL
jgi:hypothetical protein